MGYRRASASSSSTISSCDTQGISQPGKDWVSNGRNNKWKLPFTRKPGVHNVASDPSDILAVFKTFFLDSMVDKFVEFTNKYANILLNCPIIKTRVAEKQKSYFEN